MLKFLKGILLEIEYKSKVSSRFNNFAYSYMNADTLPNHERMLESFRLFRKQNDFDLEKFLEVTRILCGTDQFERFAKTPENLRMSLDHLWSARYDTENLKVVLDCFDLADGMKQYWSDWDSFNKTPASNDFSFEVEDLAGHMHRENMEPDSWEENVWENNSENASIWTIMSVLRDIYGEDKSIEILERYTNETINWSLSDLPKLFKNWDEYRDYPFTWIKEML